jgi:hypothetical protein
MLITLISILKGHNSTYLKEAGQQPKKPKTLKETRIKDFCSFSRFYRDGFIS